LTLPSPVVPELDVARVTADYERSVEAVCAEQLPLAMRVFGRLEPRRWTLEWYLPWWLGHAFGLDLEIANELVLSNVLGLASIRLQDDLVDGDVRADDIDGAKALSSALYRQAVAPYRSRFPASSPFWGHLDSSMSVWRSATDGTSERGGGGKTPGDLDSQSLAARGAPLKISAFAACMLAGRVDAYSVLERALDHALTGLVLYDHFGDWQSDLTAGRWNAFVAAVSDDPQTPESRDRNRSGVLLAMMTQDAVVSHFERITMEATRAAALVEPLGSWPLVAYLRGFADMTEEQGSRLQAHYRDLAERAGSLLLGASARA
jgi:hypothetical protein